MKNILCIASVLLFAVATSVMADEYMLQIGTKKYTAEEIRKIMNDNQDVIPDVTVSRLAKDEAGRTLPKNPKQLYKDFFDKDMQNDDLAADAPDAPEKQRFAENRRLMFENWLEHKARQVPVIYLDINQYWELVKQTEAYKSRAEAGVKLDYTNIPYTFAELKIQGNKVLASKGKAAFLGTAEFNAYVTENYDQLITSVRRSQSLTQVRNNLIKKIAAEKIVSEATELSDTEKDPKRLERYVGGYVARYMLDDELSFRNEDYDSPEEMEKALYTKFENKHKQHLDLVRKALQGGKEQEKANYRIKNLAQWLKLDGVRTRLARSLDGDKVFDWMKENRFPGNYSDALFVMTNKSYDEYLEKALADNKITFNLLK